ncbi:MAG TPA: GIY-YIG nuclease family protein, partial [Thermodesulfobacteriota bacterium]|nr:GIY-YIG nuclease family protein [Thermodesulfobacteriota bacterium]
MESQGPSPALRQVLVRLPRAPGVYIVRDRTGAALYVGKAASLRERVGAHFAPAAVRAGGTAARLAACADRIEVHETGSE